MMRFGFSALCLSLLMSAQAPLAAQTPAAERASDLDTKVRAFLDSRRDTWRDMNVPYVDGQTLHDLIVEHKFKSALEIGTSTGHSAIWIAWALSKTGGKLITIEIDSDRHRTALANFKAAGLATNIDARLADAHELVPRLEGPFDFVFSDADKDWYKNYFVAVWPKVRDGGCFTAHNVSGRRMSGIGEFLDHLKTLPNAKTTIDEKSSAGLSITCKVAASARAGRFQESKGRCHGSSGRARTTHGSRATRKTLSVAAPTR